MSDELEIGFLDALFDDHADRIRVPEKRPEPKIQKKRRWRPTQRYYESRARMVMAGTHNFLGGRIQRETQKKLLESNAHNFQRPKTEKNRLYAMKTRNPFFNGKKTAERARERVESGTHNFLGGSIQRETQLRLVREGKHASQIERTCPHCGKTGRGPAMFHSHFSKCASLRKER